MIPDATPGLAMVLPPEALIALGLLASLVAVVTAFSGWGNLHSRAHPAGTADLPNRGGPGVFHPAAAWEKPSPKNGQVKVSHCANGREGMHTLPAFALSAAAHPTSVVLSGHQNGETTA